MKATKTLIFSAVLVIPLLFSSCNKGDSIIEGIENGRSELVLQTESGKVTFDGAEMNFANFETLGQFQNKINNDQKFQKEIYTKYSTKLAIGQQNNEAFEKKYLFDKLTNDYLHAVNNDGMLVINGHLVRFDEEYQYEVSVKDRKLLSVRNEKDIDLTLVKRDTYGINSVKTGLSNGRTTQITLPGNGSNYYEYPFVIQSPDAGANQTRRYIHELFGHRGATVGSQTQHRLILRFKMLNSSNGNAGEPRKLNYYVIATIKFYAGNLLSDMGKQTFSNTQTTTNPEERVLAELFTTNYTNFGSWEANIEGNLTSRLISTNGFDYSRITGGPGVPFPVIW